MSKKKDAAAPSEPEADSRALGALDSFPPAEAVVGLETLERIESEAPPPAAAPPKAPSTFEQWAEAKGHIKRLPPAGRPRAAYVQPGPDYRVVKMHTRWPANQVLTEGEYDAAVVATYSAEIRER